MNNAITFAYETLLSLNVRLIGSLDKSNTASFKKDQKYWICGFCKDHLYLTHVPPGEQLGNSYNIQYADPDFKERLKQILGICANESHH